jgi:hypothetical protein
MNQLKSAGFSSVRIKQKHMLPVSAVSVLGTNDET